MKRSEMLLKIAKHLHKKAVELDEENKTYTADPHFESFKDTWLEDADELLGMLEKEGMNPPCIDHDKCQAIMRVYVDGNFNQWDENFEKDEKLMETYRLRMEKKNGQ